MGMAVGMAVIAAGATPSDIHHGADVIDRRTHSTSPVRSVSLLVWPTVGPDVDDVNHHRPGIV